MLLSELKWSGDVKTKKHPPEDLFATGSAAEIASWLKSSHGSKKSAMSALNFYINRAGKNLSASRKGTLEAAKKKLEESMEDDLSTEQLMELKWSGDVKTKKHPPEGLFADGSASAIVKWLTSSHSDKKGAVSALNFYINRAGKNLSADRKAVLKNALETLEAMK
jgi:hypothetical protein